ncbi:hypothetical protein BZG36_03314 [Bifiguratus adelaidae]|uniref:Up-regulated during septation protein 1 domain-containing protein n=1 Tax=Bifiguratus adelaidae TaxID=1938954 RepID=A0A261XXW9_9FUNG|nr:hypothetical protein BZG36_03314 [Bifiguratus adelaidae]
MDNTQSPRTSPPTSYRYRLDDRTLPHDLRESPSGQRPLQGLASGGGPNQRTSPNAQQEDHRSNDKERQSGEDFGSRNPNAVSVFIPHAPLFKKFDSLENPAESSPHMASSPLSQRQVLGNGMSQGAKPLRPSEETQNFRDNYSHGSPRPTYQRYEPDRQYRANTTPMQSSSSQEPHPTPRAVPVRKASLARGSQDAMLRTQGTRLTRESSDRSMNGYRLRDSDNTMGSSSKYAANARPLHPDNFAKSTNSSNSFDSKESDVPIPDRLGGLNGSASQLSNRRQESNAFRRSPDDDDQRLQLPGPNRGSLGTISTANTDVDDKSPSLKPVDGDVGDSANTLDPRMGDDGRFGSIKPSPEPGAGTGQRYPQPLSALRTPPSSSTSFSPPVGRPDPRSLHAEGYPSPKSLPRGASMQSSAATSISSKTQSRDLTHADEDSRMQQSGTLQASRSVPPSDISLEDSPTLRRESTVIATPTLRSASLNAITTSDNRAGPSFSSTPISHQEQQSINQEDVPLPRSTPPPPRKEDDSSAYAEDNSALNPNSLRGLRPGDAFRILPPEVCHELITRAVGVSREFGVLSESNVKDTLDELNQLNARIRTLEAQYAKESRILHSVTNLMKMQDPNGGVMREKSKSKSKDRNISTSSFGSLRDSSASRKRSIKAYKDAAEEVEASAATVRSLALELWQANARLCEIQRRFLEHTGGVLNVGMRRLDEGNKQLMERAERAERAELAAKNGGGGLPTPPSSAPPIQEGTVSNLVARVKMPPTIHAHNQSFDPWLEEATDTIYIPTFDISKLPPVDETTNPQSLLTRIKLLETTVSRANDRLVRQGVALEWQRKRPAPASQESEFKPSLDRLIELVESPGEPQSSISQQLDRVYSQACLWKAKAEAPSNADDEQLSSLKATITDLESLLKQKQSNLDMAQSRSKALEHDLEDREKELYTSDERLDEYRKALQEKDEEMDNLRIELAELRSNRRANTVSTFIGDYYLDDEE